MIILEEQQGFDTDERSPLKSLVSNPNTAGSPVVRASEDTSVPPPPSYYESTSTVTAASDVSSDVNNGVVCFPSVLDFLPIKPRTKRIVRQILWVVDIVFSIWICFIILDMARELKQRRAFERELSNDRHWENLPNTTWTIESISQASELPGGSSVVDRYLPMQYPPKPSR